MKRTLLKRGGSSSGWVWVKVYGSNVKGGLISEIVDITVVSQCLWWCERLI